MHVRITLLIFVLLYSITGWSKVIIRGKIIDYDGKSVVRYQPTIEGIFVPYAKEVKPSSNGTFKIEFENEGYGNTRMVYKYAHYRFFHDTNSQIYVEIKELPVRKGRSVRGNELYLVFDSLKQRMTVNISGDYEAVNTFYNKNIRSSYVRTDLVDGTYYSEFIYHSATPSSALKLLDSLKQVEINQINQLPRAVALENPVVEKKNEEIRNFLINEVHAFYDGVFLNGMYLKRRNHVDEQLKNPIGNPNLYNREWELQIEKLNEQARANLKPTPGSPDYVGFMEYLATVLTNYKQYGPPVQNPTTNSLDETVVNRLLKYDTLLFYDKKARFAYELSGLDLYLNSQTYYSPTLLHAAYDIQNKHPASINLEFYKEKIEKLRANLEVSAQDFKGSRIIQANYDSFNDLIKRFEGKIVFIDIWATWCHPCIEEFKYKTVLQPFIESDKIEMLYISVDKPEWEVRWKQSIKINQLSGNHFRADNQFKRDMWDIIGGEGNSAGSIPRYVLINKDGKVFKNEAARPSSGNELVQQIESLIK